MAQMEDLERIVKETLERRGVLSSIKGRIRSEVFAALDDKTVVKPKPSNETILINDLIREYLEYNNYNYAAMVLRAEANQGNHPLHREFLESELNIKTRGHSAELPLLYSLVHGFSEKTRNVPEELSEYNSQVYHKETSVHHSKDWEFDSHHLNDTASSQ